MLNIALPFGEILINGEFGGFYLIETLSETRQLHENNYLKVNIFSFSFALCSDYSTRDPCQMLYGIYYKIRTKYVFDCFHRLQHISFPGPTSIYLCVCEDGRSWEC